MATQRRRRRGTTAQHASFTGALAEITVDTDKKSLIVHDGVTPGGFGITPDRMFGAVADVEAAKIPAVVNSICTLGHAIAGDGGGARYKRALTEPTHSVKVQSADGAWWEIAEARISVRMAGAKGDGETEDGEAIQGAIDAALATGTGIVYLPKGRYFKSNSTASIILSGSITIVGDGMFDSVIVFDDEDDVVGRRDLLYTVPEDLVENFRMEGIGIEGSWGALDNYDIRSQLVQVYFTGHAEVTRCRFKGSRFMALILNGGHSARVTDCEFEDIKRDGCRVTRVRDTLVANNRFERVIDDAIAVHSGDDESDPLDKSIVIENNVIVDSQGISVYGAKACTVIGNVLKRIHTRAISVEPSDNFFREGGTARHGIVISGNVIEDVFNGYLMSTSSGGLRRWIYVDAYPPSQDGGSYPGLGDGAGGVKPILPYLYTNDIGANPPAPGTFGVVISGNVCRRTLGVAEAYSDYGFGERMMQDGPVDPEITASVIGGNGIEIAIHCWGLVVSGNELSGMDRGIYLNGVAAAAYVAWQDVLLQGNVISDVRVEPISAAGPGIIKVVGNILDGDPMNAHAERTANGKWSASYATFPAIRMNVTRGVFLNNTFRNVGQLITTDVLDHTFRGSVYLCNPAAPNYNANNIGIGAVFPHPAAQDGTIVIVDDDPASATFRKQLNACAQGGTAMPTSGKYLQGHFVRNQAPSLDGNNMLILGWVRLTTGSGHVAGTDWAVVRTSHVSPAT